MKYLASLAAIITLFPHAVAPWSRSGPLHAVMAESGVISPATLPGSRTLLSAAYAAEEGSGSSVGEYSPPKGREVYIRSCRACHESGALGAPRAGNHLDWEERLAKGRKALLENAVKGYRLMPAKGGRSSLTPREVALALDYMLPRSSSSTSGRQ